MSAEKAHSRAEMHENLGLRLDLALQSFASGRSKLHPDYSITGVSTLQGLVAAQFRDYVGVTAEVRFPVIRPDDDDPTQIGYIFRCTDDGWSVYELHQSQAFDPREVQVVLAESHVELLEASCANAHMVAYEKLTSTPSQRLTRLKRKCGYAIGKKMVVAAHWGAARLGYPSEVIS